MFSMFLLSILVVKFDVNIAYTHPLFIYYVILNMYNNIYDYTKKTLNAIFRYPLGNCTNVVHDKADRIVNDIKSHTKKIRDIYTMKDMFEKYDKEKFKEFSMEQLNLLHIIHSEYVPDDKTFENCLVEKNPCMLAGIDFYLEEKVDDYVFDIFPYWAYLDSDAYTDNMHNGHNKILIDVIYNHIEDKQTQDTM